MILSKRVFYLSPRENSILFFLNPPSAQKDNVKLTTYGFFSVAKKSEVQDLLDSILKIAYPYISQARKLTDMNKQLESGAELKFSLLPEALPMGYEDKTPVIVGFEKNKNGKNSVVKVYVWREGTDVYYEHKDDMFYKPITSENSPVVMDDAGYPKTVTVSATGLPWVMWPSRLGDYNVIEKEHMGRPVYSDGDGRYLYATGGGWEVSRIVGDSYAVMRSTSAAPSPILCQQWQYLDSYYGNSGPWKDGNITVTIKK